MRSTRRPARRSSSGSSSESQWGTSLCWPDVAVSAALATPQQLPSLGRTLALSVATAPGRRLSQPPGTMQRMIPPSELTRKTLTEQGYCGFVPFSELSESDVPREPGVYVVLRAGSSAPTFLPRSPAGHHKRRDPSVAVDVLAEAWVDDAEIIYVGKASAGKDGGRGLRKRLDEYRRHGAGAAVGHWGGRYIWQLEDSAALLVAWRRTPDDEDPGDTEARLIAAFIERHGARPFANRNKGVVKVP